MEDSRYLLQHEVQELTQLSPVTINKYLEDQEYSRFPKPIVATKNLKLFSHEEILQWIKNDQEKVRAYYRSKNKPSKSRKDYYILSLMNIT